MRKMFALFAAVVVVVGALACAGQPAHETQQQTAPTGESTAYAPEGAPAPSEAPAAPAEGAAPEAPAEGQPQD